jgi:hypothetical protein
VAVTLPNKLRRRNSSSCTHEPASLLPQPFHSGGSGSIIADLACTVLGQQSDSQHDRDLDTGDVGENLTIPEAQHPITVGLEPSRATLVDREAPGLCVLRTINLDNQLCGMIAEIRDVGADRHLLAKMKTMPIELTPLVPKLALSWPFLPAHATSTLAHQVGHAATPQLVTPRPLRSAARQRSRPWRGRARAGCSSAARSRRSHRAHPAG